MSAKITLTHADFDRVPGVNQICTVKYKVQGQPDSSFITVTTTAVVDMGTGNFTPSVVISGLLNGVTYIVRVSDNCNNIPVDKPFTTPLSICVALTDVEGTTAVE
jgi:hypothetical protein